MNLLGKITYFYSITEIFDGVIEAFEVSKCSKMALQPIVEPFWGV